MNVLNIHLINSIKVYTLTRGVVDVLGKYISAQDFFVWFHMYCQLATFMVVRSTGPCKKKKKKKNRKEKQQPRQKTKQNKRL